MSNILNQLNYYISGLYFPVIHVIDIIEILIIALMIYFCMVWIQRTRAYSLLKGFLVIVIFTVIAYLLQMSVILWIVSRLASVALLALFIIFQPELRKGLESLGTRNFLTSFFTSSDRSDTISDRTITEIVRAVNEMSEMRTGALIVIEQNILLTEYIETGIRLNADVSSQLLINIFEHNTPLHDGSRPPAISLCRRTRSSTSATAPVTGPGWASVKPAIHLRLLFPRRPGACPMP